MERDEQTPDVGRQASREHGVPPGQLRPERGAGAGDRAVDEPGDPGEQRTTVEEERERRERIERLQAEQPDLVAGNARRTEREEPLTE
jgi:hypothetical protein